MSLCLSNLPQNGDPKWELSLASYENTALSERQLWTILTLFRLIVFSPLRVDRAAFFRRRNSVLSRGTKFSGRFELRDNLDGAMRLRYHGKLR
jgi:hypothetical protein